MGTKNNPGSFDCYNAAEPDEPMFVLLGRDPTAAFLVTMWWTLRQEMGGTGELKLHEARACAHAMERWARAKGKDVDGALRAFKTQISRSQKEQASDPLIEEANLRAKDLLAIGAYPDKGEPVAWMHYNSEGYVLGPHNYPADPPHTCIPLYATPPATPQDSVPAWAWRQAIVDWWNSPEDGNERAEWMEKWIESRALALAKQTP